jgi:phosphomannomutase/phosphoglucomutase
MARRRRNRARRSAQQGKKGGLTLNTVLLLSYMFAVLILAAGLWVSQQLSYTQIIFQREAAAGAVAKSVAYQLTQAAASDVHALESMARDPALAVLLENGEQAAVAARARELKSSFPMALDLRIAKIGTTRPNEAVQPSVGYACVDLIRTVENGTTNSPIEVHVPGTANEHIDVVRPIVKNGKVIGYIQLVNNIKAIAVWLHENTSDTYVELSQHVDDKKPGLLLGAVGNKDLKSGSAATYTVGGTRWRAQVWSKASAPILPLGLDVLFVFVLAVVLLGGVLYYLKKAVSAAIRVDADSLLRMTADAFRGNKQHQYHLQMDEFADVAKQIEELRLSTPIDRERDDDPNAISYGAASQFNQVDPLFMNKDAFEVEEIDPSQETSQPGKSTLTKTPMPKANFDTPAAAKSPSANNISSQNAAVADVPALPPTEIFKAYDIRGIVGVTLTVQHVQLIGRAIGSAASERGLKQIVFGRDGRLSGPELGQALVQGLREAGMDVIDVGMVPTPVLYYAAYELTGGTGVVLTGSHNPPQYNGIKMMLGGETLSGDAITALHTRIVQQKLTSGAGNYSTQSVTKGYLERILGDVKLKRPLNIVIDCGNGVAGAVAPLLFKSLGCQVTELFCEVDGKFPNHHPDPSKPENLRDLIAMVKSKRADIGLAFDGDGDRLGVVASDGKIIYPDRLMMLFATDILSRNHGAQIIYDIKCSNNLTKVIWEKGGEPLMWKTGHSFIKAKMKQSGALLAGEMSGHIFFKERWYGFDDGLYSGARLLEILANDLRKSNVIFAAYPDSVSTPELNVAMREGEHHKFVEELMTRADFGDANVTMIDGIRADYADGWGLVRASNTTPVLVLRFEGQTEAAMKRIQQVFKQQMLAVKGDLKLPF